MTMVNRLFCVLILRSKRQTAGGGASVKLCHVSLWYEINIVSEFCESGGCITKM